MFTGLVETVGELIERKPTSGGYRLRIATPLARELSPGDSIACNGVCLTAIVVDRDELHADVGPETARVTTLGSLSRGALINLERPLRADGRFGGHFVLGHVDGVGHIADIRVEAAFEWITVTFSKPLAPYLIHKGSIAVDGISLTIAGLGVDRFDVQLIPFTIANTNIKRAQVHDGVNLECDMIGKYVLRANELGALSLAGARAGTSE